MTGRDDKHPEPAFRVGISGAGAMGSLFGALLHRTNAEVWLVDPWQEHMEAVQERGLLVSGEDGDEIVPLHATTDPTEPGVVDLVVLLSKTTALIESTENALPMIGSETMVLGLQNGLGNAEKVNSVVPEEQILYGLCEVGSDLAGPGHIVPHLAEGVIKFKPMNGKVQEKHIELVSRFEECGIEAEIAMDIDRAIWEKLALNACFNAVCALTRLNVRDFADRPESGPLIEAILAEVVATAHATGIELDYDELAAGLETVQAQADTHHPSMAQDVMNQRPTEIDAINGGVVEEANLHGVPAPANATITNLVKILEATYGSQF